VLVAGGGNAGLCAALSARALGASVTIACCSSFTWRP
jgi:succinate dehydrogenase/fumarate reductase flavoprotein subunit